MKSYSGLGLGIIYDKNKRSEDTLQYLLNKQNFKPRQKFEVTIG